MAIDPIVSYADPAAAAVFFKVAPKQPGRQLNHLLAAARDRGTSSQAARDYAMLLAHYLDTYHQSIVSHEWCHILQALAYPGLFLRCVREMQLTDAILASIREDPEQSLPARMYLPHEWHETFHNPVVPHRIEVRERGADIRRLSSNERRGPNDLTENDLLEDAACLFQYKVEIGSAGTGARYSQWLKERRRYTMTFKFLAGHLGLECAYVMLPGSVREAFSTNRPLPVFAGLVGFLVDQGRTLPLDIGPEEFLRFYRSSLTRSGFPVRAPNPSIPASKDPPAYLDRPTHAEFVERSVFHPLWPLARRVAREDDLASRLDRLLAVPHEFIERDTKLAPEDLRALWPPLTVIRLLHPHIQFRDSVGIISEAYKERKCPFLAEVAYSQYLFTMLGYRQLALAIAIESSEVTSHNCHHQRCPIFATNLCRQWLKVPADFENCEFSGFVTSATTRRLRVGDGPIPTLIR